MNIGSISIVSRTLSRVTYTKYAPLCLGTLFLATTTSLHRSNTWSQGDIDTLNAYADLDNLKLLNGVDYVAKAREYIENLDIKANEETAESNIQEVLDKAKEQFIVENATEDTSEDTTVYLFL